MIRKFGLVVALLLLAVPAAAQTSSSYYVTWDFFAGSTAELMQSRYRYGLHLDEPTGAPSSTPPILSPACTEATRTCTAPMEPLVNGVAHILFITTACVGTPTLWGPASNVVAFIAGGVIPTIETPVPPSTAPCAPPALSLACPQIPSVTTTSVPTAVAFPSALPSGGTPPYVSSCSPPSGAQFNAGSTSVACTATDTTQQKAACSFSVVVTLSGGSGGPVVPLAPTVIKKDPLCTYVVTGTKPDSTSGWWAQIRKNGDGTGITVDKSAPYTRTLSKLPMFPYVFDIVWMKADTAVLPITSAATTVTPVCQ